MKFSLEHIYMFVKNKFCRKHIWCLDIFIILHVYAF